MKTRFLKIMCILLCSILFMSGVSAKSVIEADSDLNVKGEVSFGAYITDEQNVKSFLSAGAC